MITSNVVYLAVRDALVEITQWWRAEGSDPDATSAGRWNQSAWSDCLVGHYMRHRGYTDNEFGAWELNGERVDDCDGFALTRCEIVARDWGMGESGEWSLEFDAVTNYRNTVPMLWTWASVYLDSRFGAWEWQNIAPRQYHNAIALDSDAEALDEEF